MENNMEYKYLIHLIFQKPLFENNQITLVTKTTTFGYENRKDAQSAYDKFNRQKYIEIATPAGKMTFNVLSVEFLDVKRYEKNKLEEEVNKDGKENREIIDANDEKSNADDEFKTE